MDLGAPARPPARTGRRALLVAVWLLAAAGVLWTGWQVLVSQRSAAGFVAEDAVRHVATPVDYAGRPTGGPHHPVWWDCGVHDGPVPAEHAVHSLEHGAVWLTYRPSLPPEQRDPLESLAGLGYVIVSPDPGQDRDVVGTAWGVREVLDGADADAARRFVVAHRLATSAPESGAACSGGTTRDLVRR